MTDDNFFGGLCQGALFHWEGHRISGMSEDDRVNITLDHSMTFSLHFGNVAPPDDCTANSAGSLRTPNSSSAGPPKELTGTASGAKSSTGRDALTDMSLFADNNTERYDYAKLSPTVNNLLQKVKEVEKANSPKNGTNAIIPDPDSTGAQDKSCIDNDISSNELVAIGSLEVHDTISNPVSTSTDTIQQDNITAVDVHEKFQSTMVERNEPDLQPNNILSKAEDHVFSISDFSSSVSRQQPKKTGQAFTLGTPKNLKRNEATKSQDTPSRERNSILDSDCGGRKRSSSENVHAEQERPEKISKALRSPITSPKQLPCVSLSSCMIEKNQSESRDNGQSVNVDWNKVAVAVSSVTDRIFSASSSNLKQSKLDMVGDISRRRTEPLPYFEEAVDMMCPEPSPSVFGEGAELGDVFRAVEASCSKAILSNRLAQRGFSGLFEKVRRSEERTAAAEARARDLASQLSAAIASGDSLREERDTALLARELIAEEARGLRVINAKLQEEVRMLRAQTEELRIGQEKTRKDNDSLAANLEEVLGEADENRSLTQGYNLLRDCLLQNLRTLEPLLSGLGAVVPERDFELAEAAHNIRAMVSRLSLLSEAVGPASLSFGDACAKVTWQEVFLRLQAAGVADWACLLGDPELPAPGSQERRELLAGIRGVGRDFQNKFWKPLGHEAARQLLRDCLVRQFRKRLRPCL